MFSIIMPLFNKEQWVGQCIQSVLDQECTDFELIIVNDGSTDNSVTVVEPFLSDSRVTLIHQKNAGVSVARNSGIAQATRSYIAFLDADDLWHPQYLAINKEVLDKDTSIDIIASNYINKLEASTVNWVAPEKEIQVETIHDYFKHAHRNLIFWTSATIVRTEALNKVGNFDSRLKAGEDIDLWFRLIMNGKGAIVKHVLAFYRLTEIHSQNRFKLPAIGSHLVSYIGLPENLYYQQFPKVPYLRSFVYTFILNYLFPYYFDTDQYKEAWKIYKTVPVLYRVKQPRHWLYLLPRKVGRILFLNIFFKRNKNIIVTEP